MPLRKIVLYRHGETDGESSVRYHGTTDVELSAEGLAHMRQLASELRRAVVDVWVASPLRRSWRAASIVSGGALVRLEPDFREIYFGRWEGLTREEIQARNPVAFEDWQAGKADFEYPGGEARADFRARVARGVERLVAAPGHTAVGVLHKGVIREIARQLTGEALAKDEPALGGRVVLTRRLDGSWRLGEHSSNPPALEEQAA